MSSYALFDDAGKFLAGRVMSEADASLQVELDSGKRVKVKSANVLLRFAKERYRESDLYTGEHAVIVLDSYVDPNTVEQVANREPERP